MYVCKIIGHFFQNYIKFIGRKTGSAIGFKDDTGDDVVERKLKKCYPL